MRCWLERTLTGCRAADDDSAAVLKRIPLGTTFEADVVTRKLRSTAWHRRYWLLMSMLASNVESVEIEPGIVMLIKSSDDAHTAIKYATGLYDTFAIEGGVVRLLKSTAFDRMDWDQWTAYWPRVLDAVHHKFLPGVSIPDVEQEIARLAS